MIRKVGQAARHPIKTKNAWMKHTEAPLARAAKATFKGTTRLGAKAFIKDTDKTVGNLWTGKKASGIATLGAFGVAGAVGTGAYQKEKHFSTAIPHTEYGGTAPIMNADGVGSISQAPTLGANGDMVFGMHNGRKG